MPLQVGDRIGDYQVVDVLGVGGMGQVYKVQNIISKRVEAMKVLLPNLESNAHLADRFMQEIEVQASLDHPHIASLHTALRVENQLIMVMEFVEGNTIDALLRNGPLPIQKAMEYTSQILSALQYAHDRNIIHRDVKPANMMLTPSGTIKLLDFGIAKISDKRLTQTGHTVGSLYYMSPEQINDPFNLDGRADLYSVGIALYEMVTGKRPFQGDSDYSIMSAHLVANPTPPIQIDPSLPEALNDIILMAIAKDRNARFQSAQAFQRALEGIGSSLGFAPAAAAAAAGAAGVSTPTMPLPTPPATQYAAPVPATPAAAQAAPSGASRRGLYVALGSLATILVLAAVAWQAPRLFKSNAASPPAQLTPTPSDPAPAQTPPQASEAQNPAPAAVPVPQQGGTQPATPLPRTEPAATPRQQQLRQVEKSAAANPPVSQQPVQTRQEPPPQQPVAAAPENPGRGSAAQPAAQEAVLREYRSQMMALGTRARSVNTTLETMRAQQARMGLNLRGDVLNMKDRMEFQLDEAERAIKGGDAEAAKKGLDAAEREIERLEKFLGR